MDLNLEGLPKPVRIAPYVIKNLSHNLNLKEQFLKKNKAELEFEGMKVALKLGNKQLELVKKSVPLVRNSTVPRFIKSMQEDKKKWNKLEDNTNRRANFIESNQVGFTVE